MNPDGVPFGFGLDLRLVAGVGRVGDPSLRGPRTGDVHSVASRAGGVDAVHHVDHSAGLRLVRGRLNGPEGGAFAQAAVRIAPGPADIAGCARSGDGERRMGKPADGSRLADATLIGPGAFHPNHDRAVERIVGGGRECPVLRARRPDVAYRHGRAAAGRNRQGQAHPGKRERTGSGQRGDI